ncbi:MAG: chemotaxis protein CheB [Myxococcota bacterium]
MGVGASAGGLEALRALITHVPPGTGMAFVLVPHLAPGHPSLLADILRRDAQIPVVEVRTDRVRLLPDHVYVLGPGDVLRVHGGDLVRTAGEEPGREAHHASIDAFLVSLAVSRGARAIGVILSGSGSDGAEGVRAIKAGGGITFAEDESAQFGEMPQSAVATGAVDHVLPPRAIAEELARVARHPFLARDHAEGEEGDEGALDPEGDGIRRVLRLLKGATGVDFAEYKQTTIRRRLARRMALRRVETFEAYLGRLEDDPAEVRALHDDLLINVTCFFREPEAFEALRATVLPHVLEGRAPDDAIRVWVPGCSTGEEVYSLAIVLLEHLADTRASFPIQIFGTDVNESAIERARAGVFDSSIERDVSPERLRRHFKRLEGRDGYQVAKRVRDNCVFAQQDIARDPPFSRIDLLSCRNVLIYLGSGLQRRVLPMFHYSLRPGGFLLLGSSESVGPFTSLFEPVDKTHRLYRKVAARRPVHLDALMPGVGRSTTTSGGAKPEASEPPLADPGREADRFLLTHFVPASIVVDESGLIVHVRGETGPYLRPAPGKPSLHLLKMAREDLLVDLDRALRDVRDRGLPVRKEGIQLRADDQTHDVTLDVSPIPVQGAGGRYYLVMFRPAARPSGASAERVEGGGGSSQARDQEVARLRQDLLAARAYHQTMVEKFEAANEELRSAHEEVLSANEELQSTNEELETAKEELQSTNEELATLNDELQHRNVELGELNSDLENLFASVGIPIALVDGGLRLRRITPAAERLFNVLPTDLDRRITDFKHSFDDATLEQSLLTVIDTLAPMDREIQDRDGRWFTLRIRPYRSVENRIDGAVLMLTDIHVVKAALVETERTRAFLESLFEAVPEPVFVVDAGVRVRAANRAFHRLFESRREDVEGHGLFEIHGARWDLPAVRDLLSQVTRPDGRVDDFEVQVGDRTCLLTARRVELGGESVASVMVLVDDVTERRRAEEALRRSEERLSSIFDHAFAGIAEVDAEGTITLANARLCDILGRSAAEVVGARYVDFVAPEERTRATSMLEVLAERGSVDTNEERLLRPDGGTVWVNRDLSLVRDAEGRLASGCVIVQDVTARRRVEQELRDLTAGLDARVRERTAALEAALRELNDFSYTVAHDLRAPLRSIASFSQILLKDHATRQLEGDGRRYLERIATAAARLDALVVALLAYGRLGRAEMPLEPVPLGPLIAETLDHLAEDVRAHGAEVVVEGDLPTVLANRVSLAQALQNLVRNAMVFVKPGVAPTVRIHADRDDQGVRLWVEDNGIGIEPRFQQRIFGVFERLHGADQYPGTGIGLAIVRRAVERMNGRVGVESEPGRGSRFWIRLAEARRS